MTDSSRTRALWCLAPFLILASQESLARCVSPSNLRAQDISMQIGQVIVRPSDPIGTKLAEREFTINGVEGVGRCDWRGGTAEGRLVQPGSQLSTLGNAIYTTSVPGIGIRMSRRIEGRNETVQYPHSIQARPDAGVNLSEGYFRVEIFKIADVTGSGPLAPGRYSTYALSGSPNIHMLTSSISGQAITIVSSSCEVQAPSRNILVDFGTTPRSDFSGVGTTTNEREFRIGLDCTGPNVGQDQVKLSFNYAPDASNAPGVMRLEPVTNTATGLGIQLLTQNDQPLENGGQVLVGQTRAGVSESFETRFKARYYQTRPNVTPGETRAQATFTIQYN